MRGKSYNRVQAAMADDETAVDWCEEGKRLIMESRLDLRRAARKRRFDQRCDAVQV